MSTVVRTGDFRRRVTVERYEETIDSAGAVRQAYVPHVTVWAQVKDLSGSMLTHSQQVNPEVRVQVTIRYRSDIVPLMRITVGARQLYTAAVLDPDGRRRYLEILCTERDPHG
ncbi:MAG: hypothetical protein DDT38_01637 [Firmicutes bacterium]|nr:hypothetical protein [candidate division NPL-UPA2 bacterium]